MLNSLNFGTEPQVCPVCEREVCADYALLRGIDQHKLQPKQGRSRRVAERTGNMLTREDSDAG